MRLLLVDGNNLVMRWAFAMLKADRVDAPNEAEMRSVVRACEQVVKDAAAAMRATHAIVCMDGSRAHTEGWRRVLYPDYKANRTGSASGLWGDLLLVHLHEAGIMIVQNETDEADDVIATLAHRVIVSNTETPHHRTVVILSGDSDLLPCMHPGYCDVYQFGTFGKGDRFVKRDAAYVCEKWGIASVDQLVLYKAMVGEPGDNLPGVKGIGEKKGLMILKAFPTAADILKSAMVPPEQFQLMLQLVTLVTTLDIEPLDPKRCRIR